VEQGALTASCSSPTRLTDPFDSNYKKADGHVWLIPHNPAYSPMMADSAVHHRQGGIRLRRI
jgi:hypothetical protein